MEELKKQIQSGDFDEAMTATLAMLILFRKAQREFDKNYGSG
jgi:hypothetical protein